jgi:hypothetical protein
VWLTPAPKSAGALGATAVAAGVGAMLCVSGGQHAAPALLAVACTAVIATALAGKRPRVLLRAKQAAMAIVPWGVIVDPENELRVLRWPGVKRVSVHVRHAMRGGTPVAVDTVVAVHTGREILAGCAAGAVGLEGLTVNLAAYADEASREVAFDLDGAVAPAPCTTEPVVADLISRARELCTTGRGAAQLGLPPGGYRSMASASASPDTLDLLRDLLEGGARTGADVRPLASILAVLVGARELVPQLLQLVSAPHPIVAAVAKAAALRLGAPQSRAGAIDEVAAFLCDEDRERLEQWAAG